MDRAEAAQRLGVRPSDVVEVREHSDGHLVVLDGRAVVINRHGTQYPYREPVSGTPDSTGAETGEDAGRRRRRR